MAAAVDEPLVLVLLLLLELLEDDVVLAVPVVPDCFAPDDDCVGLLLLADDDDDEDVSGDVTVETVVLLLVVGSTPALSGAFGWPPSSGDGAILESVKRRKIISGRETGAPYFFFPLAAASASAAATPVDHYYSIASFSVLPLWNPKIERTNEKKTTAKENGPLISFLFFFLTRSGARLSGVLPICCDWHFSPHTFASSCSANLLHLLFHSAAKPSRSLDDRHV